ncbi:MAG: hypothetical protein HC882_04485 [Acidobacteria bacterium]|nr:hypothetical protein [Acidobacteriota bacterium]
MSIEPRSIAKLVPGDALRTAWERFLADNPGEWSVFVDERTAMPTIASGSGISWLAPGEKASLAVFESRARAFMARYRVLFGDPGATIELDTAASKERRPGVWMLVFRQTVGGIPVEESRFDFHVNGTNLVAFGTHRWGRVAIDPKPVLSATQAQTIIENHIGFDGSVTHEEVAAPLLTILALDPRFEAGLPLWRGPRGAGIAHRLAWRVQFRVPGEVPLWTGEVDAKTGEVLAFYDAAHYASITGGVFPLRSTGQCDQGGCDFPHPMPFTNFVEDGEPSRVTDDFGFFECVSAADPVTTTLSGPYARIDETCGPVSETATCGESFFLGQKAGENCVVASGDSAGNTAAARTAYFHVNRVAQAAREYLPANAWLQNPVTINTNVNQTCNASWGGEINMFRGGNGCGNTGENLGVLVHEWGHGFDQNDGGGYDNTSEAYADTVALLYQRDGCIGWGFFTGGGTCSGYGDTCLECSACVTWTTRAGSPGSPRRRRPRRSALRRWRWALRSRRALRVLPDHGIDPRSGSHRPPGDGL